MQIIYGYSNCTDKKYNEMFLNKKTAVLQPDQKYHGLLIKGLSFAGVKVKCLSGLPVNRNVTKKVFINEADELEDNAQFHYYKTLNLPVLRQIMIFCGALTNVLRVRKEEQTYAMCDCLNIANAYGIVLGCKLKKIPVITIVTDLPDMQSDSRIVSSINNKLFDMVDGFVLLTEQMNERVNRKEKPFVVLEGHVDANLPPLNKDEKYEETLGKKVMIYAGGIRKMYGIQNMIEGFLKADISDAELRVFGDGDYRGELEQLVKKHENIKYMGICSNNEVVEQEQKAMLLINPRPVAPEYTKYSFPSKNMEYMVSGTPVLTTKLPGMPEEYYPYIYLIEDESVVGIESVLRRICEESLEKRQQMGLSARKFVLEEKANTVQAKRIIKFLCEEVKGK